MNGRRFTQTTSLYNIGWHSVRHFLSSISHAELSKSGRFVTRYLNGTSNSLLGLVVEEVLWRDVLVEIRPACPLIISWLPCKFLFSDLESSIEDVWIARVRCQESRCCKVLREKRYLVEFLADILSRAVPFWIYIHKKWQGHLVSCWFETVLYEDTIT